jgi:hypothetical protein
MNIAKASEGVRGKVFTFVDEAIKTVPTNTKLAGCMIGNFNI